MGEGKYQEVGVLETILCSLFNKLLQNIIISSIYPQSRTHNTKGSVLGKTESQGATTPLIKLNYSHFGLFLLGCNGEIETFARVKLKRRAEQKLAAALSFFPSGRVQVFSIATSDTKGVSSERNPLIRIELALMGKKGGMDHSFIRFLSFSSLL